VTKNSVAFLKDLPPAPTLSLVNPIRKLPSYLFKIRFIAHLHLGLACCILPQGFQGRLWISYLSLSCATCPPISFSTFDNSNNILWRVQIMKYFCMQLCPCSSYCLRFDFKEINNAGVIKSRSWRVWQVTCMRKTGKAYNIFIAKFERKTLLVKFEGCWWEDNFKTSLR
jgi:hypothetical protein